MFPVIQQNTESRECTIWNRFTRIWHLSELPLRPSSAAGECLQGNNLEHWLMDMFSLIKSVKTGLFRINLLSYLSSIMLPAKSVPKRHWWGGRGTSFEFGLIWNQSHCPFCVVHQSLVISEHDFLDRFEYLRVMGCVAQKTTCLQYTKYTIYDIQEPGVCFRNNLVLPGPRLHTEYLKMKYYCNICVTECDVPILGIPDTGIFIFFVVVSAPVLDNKLAKLGDAIAISSKIWYREKVS